MGYNDITQEVEEVVIKALAKNPQERFHTAREFRRALEAAANNLSTPELVDKPVPDKSTQALNHQIKDAMPVPEPLQTGSLPASPGGGKRWWLGAIVAAGGVLTLAALVWLVHPWGLSTRGAPTTSTPAKSSQAKPPPQVAEKVAEPTSSPLRPSQPEEAKAAAVKETKELPPVANSAYPSPAPKEKVMPLPVKMAAAPLTPPPKELVVPLKKEKIPAEYLRPIKAKLSENGFPGIHTWLDEQGRLVIAGQVKSNAQKDEIISMVKSSGFPGGMDFDQLTVVKRVVEKPARKRVVRESRESREVQESPAPPTPAPPVVTPMRPLGPKLD